MAGSGAGAGARTAFLELQSADIASLPRPIAHVKGFASRMLLPGANTPPEGHLLDLESVRGEATAAMGGLVARFRESGARTVVFDGDHFALDSFTALVRLYF